MKTYRQRHKHKFLNGRSLAGIERTKAENSRLALDKRIRTFRSIQRAYMPYVTPLLASNLVGSPDPLVTDNELPSPSPPSHPEDAPLFLPSQLIADCSQHNLNAAFDKLCDIEAELRIAQASDALNDLRQSLCVRAHLAKYKSTQVRGQISNTRARSLLDRHEAKTNAHADKYRRARLAFRALRPDDERIHVLKELLQSDIRTLTEDEDPNQSQGRRHLSWIWIAGGTSGELDDASMHEGSVHSHIYHY